jgi:large subunit ribosomal protein L31e
MAEKTEKIISINLRSKIRNVPKWKNVKGATAVLRKILKKQIFEGMKDNYKIKIDSKLNEKLWSRGIRNPPAKLKIRLIKKDENLIEAKLVE